MSDRGFIIRNQNNIHFITFAVVQWVDVFTRREYADIVVESLKFCQIKKGLKIHAWVIMSNHIHLLVSAEKPYLLSDILRDFKKFTSVQIIEALKNNTRESRRNWMLWIFRKAGQENNRNTNYQFWQQSNHPVECDTNQVLDTRLLYIHENPVRAALVRNAYEYIYSSAIDYYMDEKGLLDIAFV